MKVCDVALCNYLFIWMQIFIYDIFIFATNIESDHDVFTILHTVTGMYINSIPILIYRMHVRIHQTCCEMWGSHSGVAEDTGVLGCDPVSLDKGRESNTFYLHPQQISSYHKFTITALHNNDFRILDNTAYQTGLFSLLSKWSYY